MDVDPVRGVFDLHEVIHRAELRLLGFLGFRFHGQSDWFWRFG
jgi:hypothetical protein